jgi:hypothetical protein
MGRGISSKKNNLSKFHSTLTKSMKKLSPFEIWTLSIETSSISIQTSSISIQTSSISIETSSISIQTSSIPCILSMCLICLHYSTLLVPKILVLGIYDLGFVGLAICAEIHYRVYLSSLRDFG